jgi:trehalose-phosphatase
MSESDVAAAADAVLRLAESRHLLLLLDFDGTLCEFNPDPAAVWLPDRRRELLLAMAGAKPTTLGIVSGRRLDDVRRRAGLPGSTYFAGLHGLEIEGRGDHFVHPDTAAGAELLASLGGRLARDLGGMPGVFIEDKTLSLVAHYRVASDADAARVPEVVMRHAAPHVDNGSLRVIPGSFAMELLAEIPWHKGSAVDWIRQRVEALHHDVACVYVGDDITDEDAFRAVRGRGLAIAASTRPSGADFVIEGPAEVERLLERLARGRPGRHGR